VYTEQQDVKIMMYKNYRTIHKINIRCTWCSFKAAAEHHSKLLAKLSSREDVEEEVAAVVPWKDDFLCPVIKVSVIKIAWRFRVRIHHFSN